LRRRARSTHIGTLVLVRAVENVPENVDRGIRLDGNAGLHALLVDIFDQCARAGPLGGGLIGGIGRGDGGDGGLVVEAVQIAAGLLELLDPFVRLSRRCGKKCDQQGGLRGHAIGVFWD
jgi:hypothetical protein